MSALSSHHRPIRRDDPHRPLHHAPVPHPVAPPHRDHGGRRRHHLIEAIVLLGLFLLAVPATMRLTHKLPRAADLASTTIERRAPIEGDRDADGLDDAEEDALLARYSPIALVAQDDPSLPASIDWLRSREELHLDGPRVFGALVPRRQFSDDTRRGSAATADWTVYGHAYAGENGDLILQYWFYYPFNDAPLSPLFDHESDWEHVSVVLDRFRRPREFALARHDHNAPGVRFPWDRVPRDGDHPWFSVAAGTHAAYLDREEAPFWERVADCPRGPDGTPKLDGCPVVAWRSGPGQPAAILNVGERGAPRLSTGSDGFLMAYAGLWGAPAAGNVGSAAPAGPPFQRGFCADAAPGTCR